MSSWNSPERSRSSYKEQHASPSIVVVCDATPGLVARKLDIYRFFRKPVRIVLVRRGAPFFLDPRIRVEQERICLPLQGDEHEKNALSNMAAALSVIGYLLHTFFLATKLHRRGLDIQLVHAHFIFPQGLFGVVLARLCRVPFVISAVGDDVNQMMRRNTPLRAVCRFVLARADVTIAVSRPLQRALQRSGVSSIYLPNSVDTTSISPKRQSPRNNSILFVGTMMSAKRPILLLRAFERVVARVPEAALIMVGRGPLREAVEKNIRERKLDDKVRLIPVATPGFVIGLLSRVQVFVLPSQSEGLSNALLEAMAAGKAIVASDNESHRAMFRNGDNALLFRLDDHEDLAEKITLILTDRRLRSRLSRSARELCVQRFSTTQLGPKLENLYLATVQSASPHNRYKALSFQRSTTVARNS